MICYENQWTGFYMIRNSVIKELKNSVSKNKTCKVSVKLETSVTLLIDFLVNVSAGSLQRLK